MNTLTSDTNVPLQKRTVKGPTKNREKRMSRTTSRSAIEYMWRLQCDIINLK